MGIFPYFCFGFLIAIVSNAKAKVVKMQLERRPVLAEDLENRFNPPLSLMAVAPVKMNLSGVIAYDYFVNISLGTPPQRLLALVDTGSFYTWVIRGNCKALGGPNTICEGKYPTFKVKESTTGRLSKVDIPLRYGLSDRRVQITGRVYFDQLIIGDSAQPNHIPIGETLVMLLKNPWYSHPPGILGLGLPGCTIDDNCTAIENLVKTSEFKNETMFSITLSQCPVSNPAPCPDAGTLIFNGFDDEHCNTSESAGPWNRALRSDNILRYPYWSVFVPRMQIGRTVLKIDTHFILDSGAPVLSLPESVYEAFSEEYPMLRGGKLNCSEPISFYFWVYDDQHRYQIWPGDFLIPDPATGLCHVAIQHSLSDMFILGTPLYRSFCVAHKLVADGLPKVALHPRKDRPPPFQ